MHSPGRFSKRWQQRSGLNEYKLNRAVVADGGRCAEAGGGRSRAAWIQQDQSKGPRKRHAKMSREERLSQDELHRRGRATVSFVVARIFKGSSCLLL